MILTAAEKNAHYVLTRSASLSHEQVSGYTHLATEALADGYFGLADAGILK